MPRVKIACSGLGRVRRGNETWAQNVAEGLYRAGTPVTLLGGGPLASVECPYQQIPNIPREFALTRSWLSWHRRYLLEQLSATAALLLRKWDDGDILHVADPDMALQLRKRAKRLRVIYKDGELLGPSFCSRFEFVQVLAPYYREQARQQGYDTTSWFVIPHLVNIRKFFPAENRGSARRKLEVPGISADACVALGVGDYSPSSSKRLDWIVAEFARLPRSLGLHLVLAGQASGPDFARFEAHARASLGDRVHLFRNLSAEQMTGLYQAADIFVHAALREPFGIVFLEAMASGLPIVAHCFPVTKWIVGDGGCTIDMTEAGRLGAVLEAWAGQESVREAIGLAARKRAMSTFSEDQIVALYQQMYAQILEQPRPS